ncbi:hypothetical protein K438DRAFT_1977148 [Mycena galopus ATCC 62051]|nr:hypothetical protein K438DRAFT_1977148 [Mycena galopus ATCC 62051]
MALPYFPPSPGLLLCEPIYAPDPGHKDRLTHNTFFAVVHEDWRGVVTSENTITRMLNAYPKARTFHANTWSRFDELWTEDCKEWHEHPNAIPVPASKMPSPRNKGELPTEDARKREFVVKENLRRNLALTRPPPVPIDAARADAMFTSVLGPHAAAPSRADLARLIASTGPASRRAASAQSPSELADGISAMAVKLPPTYDARIHGTLNRHAHTRASPPALPIEPLDGKLTDGEGMERHWTGLDAPVMYAVSGHRRLDRAVAVFKATPGADLAYSRNTDDLLCFLEEEDDVLPELLDEGSK